MLSLVHIKLSWLPSYANEITQDHLENLATTLCPNYRAYPELNSWLRRNIRKDLYPLGQLYFDDEMLHAFGVYSDESHMTVREAIEVFIE